MTNTKSSKVKAIDLNPREDWVTILWEAFAILIIGAELDFLPRGSDPWPQWSTHNPIFLTRSIKRVGLLFLCYPLIVCVRKAITICLYEQGGVK